MHVLCDVHSYIGACVYVAPLVAMDTWSMAGHVAIYGNSYKNYITKMKLQKIFIVIKPDLFYSTTQKLHKATEVTEKVLRENIYTKFQQS